MTSYGGESYGGERGVCGWTAPRRRPPAHDPPAAPGRRRRLRDRRAGRCLWEQRLTSTSTVAKSAAVPPAGSDLGAVEHVIFLMMENRSFDHYYGTYPGVRGSTTIRPATSGAFSQPIRQTPGDARRPADCCRSTSTP